ncbi:VOC family protein [soil metagenome]
MANAFSIGITELRVSDLPHATSFYKVLIGLEEVASLPKVLVLGWKGVPILRLIEDAAALPELPGSAGLYHIALLFSEPAHLSLVLDRILRQAPQFFKGSSDHLVSEAFYFEDPDGNGVELYVDRPRSGWPMQDGKLLMGSEWLDPEAFMRRHFNPELTGNVSMGHLHLRVGDVSEAVTFYRDLLGFDVVVDMPRAVFLSKGGYHHHIGANAWESSGAGKRRSGSLGLVSITLIFPPEDVTAIQARLRKAGVALEKVSEKHYKVEDSWGIQLNIATL